MSGEVNFGATITGGIQDVAGLLPLLGTEQCEEHIGSALTGGYLYAAATPMSIFGSLGMARAGFKTLLACIPSRTWSGAKILANMGFEPTGINLSLVMIDKNDKDGRHLAETRLDELVKDLHIDKSRVTVSHKCARWNVTMILLTAFLSSLGIIPYIHLNLQGTKLTHFSQWTFPILRAVGGFLTASMMQIVIERRISRITASHLAKIDQTESLDRTGGSPGAGAMLSNTGNVNHAREAGSDASTRHGHHDSGSGDIETGIGIPDAPDPAGDRRATEGKPDQPIPFPHDPPSWHDGALDWVFLGLLLAGILSSVVGYVGCFSVVQNANANAHTGPLSWLCLEAGLSVIRMILWGLNPKGDDAPPLELVLRLDHNAILPTCNLDNAHILQEKILPLTRASQFLNMITSFAGLVERFVHPDLTLYYTLTRNGTAADSKRSDEAGRRVLYIAIFDHKERTTRIYTRDGTTERFYSTESDVPFIDLRHGVLEMKLDNEIISEDDPIAGNPEIRSLLQTHYQSIMDQIHFTLGETENLSAFSSIPPAYIIENKWTLIAADTMGVRERTRIEEQEKGFHGPWASAVERGRTAEVNGSQRLFERDCLYFKHRRIEEMRQSLDEARGRWIGRYMEFVIKETRVHLESEATAVRRIDGEPAENVRIGGKEATRNDEKVNLKEVLEVVEKALIDERFLMEKLLAYEVEAWEGLAWNRMEAFLRRNDVPTSGKEPLTREWRGNCWKRLTTNIVAMDARMEAAKAEISALPNKLLQGTLNSRLKDKQDEIRRTWQAIIERLVDTPTPSPLFTASARSRFSEDVQQRAQHIRDGSGNRPARLEQEQTQHQKMARRLEKELADVEFRIAQGLDRCDQFSGIGDLLVCRHSPSKSLFLLNGGFKAPLDVYSRALKANGDAIFIEFYCDSDREYVWFAETICDMPSVTSIRVFNPERLPPIHRDTPLFIDDFTDSRSLETFLDNDQSLARTHDTYVFMKRTQSNDWTVAVSFVGPSTGGLILRLKHHADEHGAPLTVFDTPFTLDIPESFTIDDISLHPIGNSSSQQLTFKPNIRNNLILQRSAEVNTCMLEDIQLLDESGNPYDELLQHNDAAAKFDTLGTLDSRKSS